MDVSVDRNPNSRLESQSGTGPAASPLAPWENSLESLTPEEFFLLQAARREGPRRDGPARRLLERVSERLRRERERAGLR